MVNFLVFINTKTTAFEFFPPCMDFPLFFSKAEISQAK